MKETNMTSEYNTDLERFIELYKDFGVVLEIKHTEKGHTRILINHDPFGKITGYPGFYSNVYFDKDGKFIEQGFYE